MSESQPRDQFYATLGTRVGDARRQAGITQVDLAKAFGVTRSSIANLEGGRQHPPMHMLVELAVMLDFELPSVAISPPAGELLAGTLRQLKAERDRLQQALEDLIALARGARWPAASPNEETAPPPQ